MDQPGPGSISPLRFGHPEALVGFWRGLIGPLLQRHATPFYLFSATPLEDALAQLNISFRGLPLQHWLSCKTQPLPSLLRWWQRRGFGIEVVSEMEFHSARQAGFDSERILVNGPAKQHWLPRCAAPGLLVNFDSMAEIRALAASARRLNWTCGLRLQTSQEFDPQTPSQPTQFGFTPDEGMAAVRALHSAKLTIRTLHFHLRTNIESPRVYEQALNETAAFCRSAGLSPDYVDCGGGYPAPYVLTRRGKRLDADFNLSEMAQVYGRALRLFPALRQLWLENGRWLTARSGVLVVKILQTKERPALRSLICDGGRTMNALVSLWEQHALWPLPNRSGPATLTAVNGPTCMAFDQLARLPLSRRLRPGDHLVWMDAGAYHLPWETEFSHPLATIFWHDGKHVRRVRAR